MQPQEIQIHCRKPLLIAIGTTINSFHDNQTNAATEIQIHCRKVTEKNTEKQRTINTINQRNTRDNQKITRPEAKIQSVQNKQVLNSERSIIKIMNPFKIPFNFGNRLNLAHYILNS